jgi:dTDP-4-dehydrorhamnose reductase
MRVLVLGATGLLGSALYRVLHRFNEFEIFGTIRAEAAKDLFPDRFRAGLISAGDLGEFEALRDLFGQTTPDAVVNCVAAGRSEWADANRMISLFALLPQRVHRLCEVSGARFVQISSDGVFSGARGGYSENDWPDASDLYGVVKQLGEIQATRTVTLRTSLVGHSLSGESGLLDWFLAQHGACRGYSKAIFTGLPTVTVARLIADILLRRPELAGVYHLASRPISKLELLRQIAQKYKKDIVIMPDETTVLDRSLVADKFRLATGYEPQLWSTLVADMHADWETNKAL